VPKSLTYEEKRPSLPDTAVYPPVWRRSRGQQKEHQSSDPGSKVAAGPVTFIHPSLRPPSRKLIGLNAEMSPLLSESRHTDEAGGCRETQAPIKERR